MKEDEAESRNDRMEEEGDGPLEEDGNEKKCDSKSENKIPSVIVEDTSAPAVRTPSKVGNKDFEVLIFVMSHVTFSCGL